MRPLLGALIAVLTFAAWTGAQPVPDHLKCYKVKDPQPKAIYTADLGGLVAEPGCKIKVPSTIACVPATKENVQPTPPGAGGTGTPNAFACYKIRCPKGTLPPLQLNDQFGTRTVTPVKSKLICAPVAATTSTCVQPFTPSLNEFVDAFSALLDASGNFEAPPSCGGSPSVCCPGGLPGTPCGPLHADLMAASFAPAADPNSFNLSLRMHLATVSDLPVTVPLIGDCLLKIDTTPGPSSTVQFDIPVYFTSDRLRMSAFGTVAVTDLTSDDVQLSGSIGCSLANLGIGFFIGTLTDQFSHSLLPGLEGLCRLCDSNTIAPCGGS